MIGKLDEYLRFNQTALNLRAQRQQILASNIANADTPNYKARDIDFTKALEGAMGKAGPTQAPELAKSTISHLAGKSDNSINGTPLLYRTTAQGNVDGNTVDMDAERNQFVDNAVRYEAGLVFINGQLKKMLSAIQGQ